jgi:hypothetical protein
MIKGVMKIDPEATVEFEDRKRPIAEIVLRLSCSSKGGK